jgi:hypothetical protein
MLWHDVALRDRYAALSGAAPKLIEHLADQEEGRRSRPTIVTTWPEIYRPRNCGATTSITMFVRFRKLPNGGFRPFSANEEGAAQTNAVKVAARAAN